MNLLVISGSRNREGQTARAVGAFLDGAAAAGGRGETVFLPELRLERCRQCDANGWGLCRAEGRCVIEDDFAGVVEKMRAAAGLVLATPVYFSDLSESLRAFLDRLRRIGRHEAGKDRLVGKPLVGICVAGGGGGGAPNCCVNVERIAATCGFNVVDMVPARRQNLEMKLDVLRTVGRWFVTAAH